MKQLLVVADDFGLTTGVVEGIIDAHENGIVTATSVMVNAPAAPEAFAYARAHPSLAVGLHFVLTFGRPVGPPAALGDLVDDEGRFRRRGHGAHERATPERVREELDAQLEALERGLGRPPTHIDGHHHVHVLPGVLVAVLERAAQLKIPVRSTDPLNRGVIRKSGVETPERFVESFYGSGHVDVEALLSVLRDLPDTTSELMCHPARKDDMLSTLSGYTAPRYEELQALTSPAVREAIEAHAIQLVMPNLEPRPAQGTPL